MTMPRLAQTPLQQRLERRRISTDIRKMPRDTLWINFASDPLTGLQNFTPALIDEFHGLINTLRSGHGADRADVPYAVIQSTHESYFSVGGDLAFFRNCIQTGDEGRLRDYSMKCLNLMYAWSSGLNETITSIALVQGRALGGGFEMALSADYLIAEEQSTFGFPEIMFGLFPCTGAMGLLASRIGARHAERMMTNKKLYTAKELFDMGLIDEVCPAGQGELAVEQFIGTHASRLKARLKVQASRYRHSPLNFDEGVRVVDDWVQTAMMLTPEELRSMDMLIMMQRGSKQDADRIAA